MWCIVCIFKWILPKVQVLYRKDEKKTIARFDLGCTVTVRRVEKGEIVQIDSLYADS